MLVSEARHNATAPLIVSLNALLADTIALYLKTKNYHWHVSGPNFRDYHLMLDDQASQLFAMTDMVAERVRKLGGATLRSVGDVVRHQRIADDDREQVPALEMMAGLLADNRTFVAALRDLKTQADAAEDNATSGLVDNWTDEAEQRVWFLAETVG
jgi:starvation-inducible DNA-binding protein